MLTIRYVRKRDDASEIDVEENGPGFWAFCIGLPFSQSSCGCNTGSSTMKFCGEVEHTMPVKVVLKIDFVNKSNCEIIISKKTAFKNIPSAFKKLYCGTLFG